METSNLIATLRQWTGVLLLGSLLILGPIAQVASAAPSPLIAPIGDVFLPDLSFVEAVSTYANENGIESFLPDEQRVTDANVEAEITFNQFTTTAITTGSTITITDEEIGNLTGTTVSTMSANGTTSVTVLSDQNGEQWTLSLDSVVEIEEGFQLLGTFTGNVEGSLVTEPFEAILGFDGSITAIGDEENLTSLAAAIAPIVERVATPSRNVGAIVGAGIIILAMVLLFCFISIWKGWGLCEADQNMFKFPIMDRLEQMPYVMAA